MKTSKYFFPSKKKVPKPTPVREVTEDEIEYRAGAWYIKDKAELLTGTKAISYYKDGSKKYERPYLNGKRHGTAFKYYEDGSKEIGTSVGEREDTWNGDGVQERDGSKRFERIWENGTKISS